MVVGNVTVSAPQSLAVQMQSSDNRMRLAALAAVGAPAQYMDHGHVAFPHSVRLDFLALSDSNERDAILTAELDQHLVSAIFMPENGQWRRIATVLYPTSFSNSAKTPDTFLRTSRSLLQPLGFTAIFHTTTHGSNGDFTDTEVHLRILNGRATITTNFVSSERTCDPKHQSPCDLTRRWLQPDGAGHEDRFLLVTATGHENTYGANDPIADAETFEDSRLRVFTCQPFAFSETTLHFEPAGDPSPCLVQDTSYSQPRPQPRSQLRSQPRPQPNGQTHGQALH